VRIAWARLHWFAPNANRILEGLTARGSSARESNLPDQIIRRMDEKIQKDAADLADGILGFFGLGKDKEEEASRRRRAAKQN